MYLWHATSEIPQNLGWPGMGWVLVPRFRAKFARNLQKLGSDFLGMGRAYLLTKFLACLEAVSQPRGKFDETKPKSSSDHQFRCPSHWWRCRTRFRCLQMWPLMWPLGPLSSKPPKKGCHLPDLVCVFLKFHGKSVFLKKKSSLSLRILLGNPWITYYQILDYWIPSLKHSTKLIYQVI